MISKILPNIWKFTGTDKVNVYFLDFSSKILIDTGNRADRHLMLQFLSKVIDFDRVDKVIFTHLHYDHIGNFDLFKNAEFFASEEEIKELERDREGTILNKDMVEKFNVKLRPLPEKIDGLEVIKTPGHTVGSVCLWYDKEKILFSGDTLFSKKQLGRTDLPTSAAHKMHSSVMKLINYNYRIIAPGHDY